MNQDLCHYGVLGMKWGIRKKRSSSNPITTEKVFISGTSKMQSKESPYYRKALSKEIVKQLNSIMDKKAEILIGDCVGADAMVQDFLAKHKYDKVHIYTSGNEVRNNADKNGTLGWKVHNINADMYEKDSKEWHEVKDKVMNKEANSGLAIILDDGAKATRKNIDRFIKDNKDVYIYELNKNKQKDKRVYKENYKKGSD